MHCQYRLLGFTLDRYGLYAWLACCHPNGASIGGIVFVPADERLYHLTWHQLDFVSHCLQLSRPVLRAATCLHADQTLRVVRKPSQELRSLELLADHFAGL